MWRLIGAVVAPPLRREIRHGRKVMLRSMALATVAVAGGGLLLTSAVLGLSAWLGPIAATGLLGLALLAMAFVVATTGRKRHIHHPEPAASLATNGVTADMLLPGLGFVSGFVLSRVLMQRLAGDRKI